jgi:hypothetical protein
MTFEAKPLVDRNQAEHSARSSQFNASLRESRTEVHGGIGILGVEEPSHLRGHLSTPDVWRVGHDARVLSTQHLQL